MFCPNCGTQVQDGSVFCPNCGTKIGAPTATEKVASVVDSVESNLNQVASDIEAGVGNAFHNLENDLTGAAKEVANDIGMKTNNTADYSAPQQNDSQYNNGASQQNIPQYNNWTQQQTNYSNIPPVNNGYNQQQYGNQPVYNNVVSLLKTDRSLLVYILLCIVTCGIYGWYFIYSIARDVNICCDGDGEHTSGLLMFILLSIVTCGIYSYIWFYKLGNRLNKNAYRYGMVFTENGTSVLMWQLFGVLLCGIGPFIAMNIIIKNTNTLCAAYNNYNARPAN